MTREWIQCWARPDTYFVLDVPHDDVPCLRNLGKDGTWAACEAAARGASDFAVATFMARHAR